MSEVLAGTHPIHSSECSTCADRVGTSFVSFNCYRKKRGLMMMMMTACFYTALLSALEQTHCAGM